MTVLVRPVGPWRFLTPLEHIAAGDLGRLIDSTEIKNHMWSPIDKDDEWGLSENEGSTRVVGYPVVRAQKWEFIRPLEGGTYIPYVRENP